MRTPAQTDRRGASAGPAAAATKRPPNPGKEIRVRNTSWVADSSPKPPPRELAQLHARLAEAEGTLHAIRTGEVDAVVTAGKNGLQVFTLEGAGHAYRILIESMNEGALILTADKTILYANQSFAQMVMRPLEQVIGNSLRVFLSVKDWTTLRSLPVGLAQPASKIQIMLPTFGGLDMPVQISTFPLPSSGSDHGSLGLVVTDMTEARRNEAVLRAWTHRVVEVQETERSRVALELHNHITQLLCAVLVRSQTLADQLSPHEARAKQEAVKLRHLLGHAAGEVERISRNLRPSILDELGLVALLRQLGTEFTQRTGVELRLTSLQLTHRLPSDVELTLYRVLQEALLNISQHAQARHVTVALTKQRSGVQLVVQDDGIGFDPNQEHPNPAPAKCRLGLLSMRERASYVGGVLTIRSAPRTGTRIAVRIPLAKSLGKPVKNQP